MGFNACPSTARISGLAAPIPGVRGLPRATEAKGTVARRLSPVSVVVETPKTASDSKAAAPPLQFSLAAAASSLLILSHGTTRENRADPDRGRRARRLPGWRTPGDLAIAVGAGLAAGPQSLRHHLRHLGRRHQRHRAGVPGR